MYKNNISSCLDEHLKLSKKTSTKTSENHLKSMKNQPGSLPKCRSKIEWNNYIEIIGTMCILASNLVPGEGPTIHFLHTFSSLRQPWGARMAARPSPRAPGIPPDLDFWWISVDLHRFCDDLCLFILIRLSAVNLENCLQGKVLDNTFDILIFCSMELGWNRKLSTL